MHGVCLVRLKFIRKLVTDFHTFPFSQSCKPIFFVFVFVLQSFYHFFFSFVPPRSICPFNWFNSKTWVNMSFGSCSFLKLLICELHLAQSLLLPFNFLFRYIFRSVATLLCVLSLPVNGFVSICLAQFIVCID